MNRAALLDAIGKRAQTHDRFIVALAGPPGAGKSTVASALEADLASRDFTPKVIQMDGYHLDNDTLDARGLRARKGAPNTFDAEGFVELIARLRSATVSVPYPLFDRARDCVVPDAGVVESAHDLLLVEGNYLLLDAPPWHRLGALFDMTIMLNPGMATLEQRLVQRWLDHGHTPAQALERARSNDIPNAELVLAASREADLTLESV